MMRGLWMFTWVEVKLFLREPMALFFTLAFPLLLLFVFGTIFGNEPIGDFGDLGLLDLWVPAIAVLIITQTALVSLPALVAGYRERKFLRMLRTTPIRPQTVFAALTLSHFISVLTGIVLLVIAGKVFYALRFNGSVINIFLALVLCSMSFFTLGFMVASIASTSRIASAVGSLLFFPMMFLSGATIPWEVLPDRVRQVARVFPMTHAVQLLQQLWLGHEWTAQYSRIGVLIGVMVVGIFVSLKTFKWE